jgi:hypothetical protein
MFQTGLAGILKRISGQKMPAGTMLGNAALGQ